MYRTFSATVPLIILHASLYGVGFACATGSVPYTIFSSIAFGIVLLEISYVFLRAIEWSPAVARRDVIRGLAVASLAFCVSGICGKWMSDAAVKHALPDYETARLYRQYAGRTHDSGRASLVECPGKSELSAESLESSMGGQADMRCCGALTLQGIASPLAVAPLSESSPQTVSAGPDEPFLIEGMVSCPLEVKKPTLYAASLAMPVELPIATEQYHFDWSSVHTAKTGNIEVVLLSSDYARLFKLLVKTQDSLEGVASLLMCWTFLLGGTWTAIVSALLPKQPDSRLIVDR